MPFMKIFWGSVIFMVFSYIVTYIWEKKDKITLQKSILLEKNCNKKQGLREQISKLEKELKESEEAYEKNKILLAEALSDETLRQMVRDGQCTTDQAEDYKNSRRVLELLIATRPTERKSILWSIDILRKELNELE